MQIVCLFIEHSVKVCLTHLPSSIPHINEIDTMHLLFSIIHQEFICFLLHKVKNSDIPVSRKISNRYGSLIATKLTLIANENITHSSNSHIHIYTPT